MFGQIKKHRERKLDMQEITPHLEYSKLFFLCLEIPIPILYPAFITNSNSNKMDQSNLSKNKGRCSRKGTLYTNLEIVLTSRRNVA